MLVNFQTESSSTSMLCVYEQLLVSIIKIAGSSEPCMLARMISTHNSFQIFSYSSVLTYVLVTQKNCLIATVVLSTQNIWLGCEMRKFGKTTLN